MDRESSDQTVLIHMLIWKFADHILCPNKCVLVVWLKYLVYQWWDLHQEKTGEQGKKYEDIKSESETGDQGYGGFGQVT